MYCTYFMPTVPDSQKGKENMQLIGFFKFDLEKEELVKRISFGPTHTAGEVYFQERENPTSEDDGYLMTFVYDWTTDTSEFVMWDAITMNQEPVLRLALKQRVPYGFHSYFVKEDEI